MPPSVRSPELITFTASYPGFAPREVPQISMSVVPESVVEPPS